MNPNPWIGEILGAVEDNLRNLVRSVDVEWHQVMAECEERSPDPELEPVEKPIHGFLVRLTKDAWPPLVSMGMETGAGLTQAQRELFLEVAGRSPLFNLLVKRLDREGYQEMILREATNRVIDQRTRRGEGTG